MLGMNFYLYVLLDILAENMIGEDYFNKTVNFFTARTHQMSFLPYQRHPQPFNHVVIELT